jgi:hypothetical protein
LHAYSPPIPTLFSPPLMLVVTTMVPMCFHRLWEELVLYVDPNSIRRLTTERSEARRREAWAVADSPPRYGSLLPPIYTPCKPPARVSSHHKITHGVCKHTPDIVKFCWLAPVVFYLSLLERVFHVKILCLRAVISFSFFVIVYRFCNSLEHMDSVRL